MDTTNLTLEELNALINLPPVPLPPGVAHSTVNPYSVVFYLTSVPCLVVTTTVVAGRIFTRLRISHNIGLDDCMLMS